jgi:holo-[acyl-carrier protein] synthase
MERWLINLNLLKRFFHPDELEFALSLGKNAAQTLAARFAAKEAYGKALGTGLANINLVEITVVNQNNGKPEIKLFGTAQKALKNSGADKVHISITHEKEFALAMVVLEGT